jgi:hypothetical protein
VEQPGDASDSRGSDSFAGAWLSEYMARTTEFWQRTSRAGSSAAARWGDRSLQQDEWTVDTVTADIVEAWEELTPLMGEGLELWIELVQWSLRAGRPDA